MLAMNPTEHHPHRRHNPLSGEWILVSPHRALRPWQGAKETVSKEVKPAYHETCYLCPGNERIGGEKNPVYSGPYAFKNDFAALLTATDNTSNQNHTDELFQREAAHGECRVICFSPRHDLSLPEMELPAIREVVDLWSDQTTELGNKYCWVQIFENKGAAMGCSNPHPHGQIWASDFLPNEATKEDIHQAAYLKSHGSNLLLDYAQSEIEKNQRIVAINDDWVVVVPYWATWPFETLLLPRTSIKRFNGFSARPLSRHPQTFAHALRQFIRNIFSLLNGLARCTISNRCYRSLAVACTLLSTTIALCYRQEIHGGL